MKKKIKRMIVFVFVVIVLVLMLAGCQPTVDNGEPSKPMGPTIIGPAGGIVLGAIGASVELLPDVLDQQVVVNLTETKEADVRKNMADSVSYLGAVTVDISAVSATAETVDASKTMMRVTVPLKLAQLAGDKLAVYWRGVDDQWVLIEVMAIVDLSGWSASFETNKIGTFLVRSFDEQSFLTIDYDSLAKSVQKSFTPTLGYGLHSVNPNPDPKKIPIILIHGIGSQEFSTGVNSQGGQYARWDNFIAWAKNGGLDLNIFELWWFLHNSFLPVGFDSRARYATMIENNVQQLVEAIDAQRLAGKFPESGRQFMIVAHSRGGLVARALMQNWPDLAEDVSVAITLATPHHGSPLAVPDWSFQTLFENSILLGSIGQQLCVWQNVSWWWPGYADLAWDNYDGTIPYPYGLPVDRWSFLNTWLNGVGDLAHQVTTNDAGWPTDLTVSDYTLPLPSAYVLDDGRTHGRPAGNTLWDLNHNSIGDDYLDKFIFYAGYLTSPLATKNEFIDRVGLSALNLLMSWYESEQQTAPHFAANDGLVPVQSALCLKASQTEPIYATEIPWWDTGQRLVKRPLTLDLSAIESRLPLGNKNHQRLFADFDHLDMVAGKTNLFDAIGVDIKLSRLSAPTAVIVDASITDARVTLDVSGSYDNATSLWPATTLKYRLDWGEGAELKWGAWSASTAPTHTYTLAGTYVVSLQVCDQDGMLGNVEVISVTIGNDGGGEGEGEGEDGAEPGQIKTILLPGNVPLELVWIPSGSFLMGRYAGEPQSFDNEDPQHLVTIPFGFWLGRYELTKAQWVAVMGVMPWLGESYVLDDPNSPAVSVSWDDTQAFIGELNAYTGKIFRLPSESEWEYACRAETTTRFYWGDDYNPYIPLFELIDNYAWYDSNSWNDGEQYAHVVGLKWDNNWGLYDMSGNAWEWCEDDWHDNYVGAPADGLPWINSPRGLNRVLRSGSARNTNYNCRSSLRFYSPPNISSYDGGFRLVMNP